MGGAMGGAMNAPMAARWGVPPAGQPGLPGVPDGVVDQGAPRYGRYAGRLDRIDWSALQGVHRRSRWWRRLHHKRWQYVGIGCREVFVGVAIVDLGWSMTAFAYVFDRIRQRVIADWAQDGLPGLSGFVSEQPVQGAEARFRGLGASLTLVHEPGDILALRVKTPAMRAQIELALGRCAPFLLAVGPIQGGVAHATQKSPALPVQGWVEADAQHWDLGQAVGCLDSSSGLLAHDTSWRWACAHRHDVGFNLQQGYFGGQENALWLDGELIPLGAAHFEFDPERPLAPWHVGTDDGLLDLHFQPEGARSSQRDLLVAASHYVQPVGTFYGQVRRSAGSAPTLIEGLLGVTEDHRSRW